MESNPFDSFDPKVSTKNLSDKHLKCVTENMTLPPCAHLWFSEYNLAHPEQIRTKQSGDVCNNPQSHNIGGTRFRWGQGPRASARASVIVRASDEMSVKNFIHLLFVCVALSTKAKLLHCRAGIVKF